MAFNARDHGLNPKLKPHLKDVNKYVTGNYAVYWRLIGENLKVPNLNTIAMDNYSHPRSNHQCFRVMIGAWLQIDIAATWEKLQKAINEAIEAEHGTLQTGPNSGTEERDKPETGSQVGSSGSGIQIDPEGFDMSAQPSKPTGAKRGHGDDEVDARPTNDVKIPKPSAADHDNTTEVTDKSMAEVQGVDPVPVSNKRNGISNVKDGIAGGSVTYPSAKIDEFCMKEYHKISKDKQAFAIIFDNENFGGDDDRTGTEEDVRSICSLTENFKETIVFHKHIVKNLTKNEMIGAFKMLGKPDPSTLNEEEMKGAIKLFYPPDKYASLLQLPKDGKESILESCQKVDFKEYSCFMAFIMSHGDKKGIAGTDGKFFQVDTLSDYLTPKECKELKDKPKIFFLQYCRGKDVDIVTDEFQAPKDDKTPNRADFLYVYATPENYAATRSRTQGTVFIQTLVEVMKKTLYHYHLEEVLLFVKNEMGQKSLEYERESDTGQQESVHIKQVLSVVSQLRGRVFFVED